MIIIIIMTNMMIMMTIMMMIMIIMREIFCSAKEKARMRHLIVEVFVHATVSP